MNGAGHVFPSGEQYRISHGQQEATIVEVGGGIREYRIDGRPVLDPYPPQAMCDGAHGAVLVPWPNRLDAGRYRFDGEENELPLTEPEHGNAIHGLLRWRNWRPLEHADERVVVGIRLYPQPGWPFPLDVSVAYELDDAGLTVSTTATNVGAGPCPFGLGQHPYLSPGADAVVDDCTLELRAQTRILVDPERQLPTGSESVRETDFDFSDPRRLGRAQLDDPFTDLDRDAAGRAWVRLGCPDGATVELWCDDSYPIIQLYTGDTLTPDRRRRGLAAEPMTCPPMPWRRVNTSSVLNQGRACPLAGAWDSGRTQPRGSSPRWRRKRWRSRAMVSPEGSGPSASTASSPVTCSRRSTKA